LRVRTALMATSALAAVALAAAAVMCLGSGCGGIGYYAQSVSGHVDLMRRARPVDNWLADDAANAALKQRLQLAQQMRQFSVHKLMLPDNASYTSFADLQRPAAVWNVVAAPQLSLKLKTWCYPVTGCVGYRGYFDRNEADALAGQLRGEGLQAIVYGVPAYSTLGWTNWLGGDPLLNTFVNGSEGELARLIFHELAHQQVYAADDTTFNESFATAVERIGVALWFEQHGSEAARAQYRDIESRRRDFRSLTAQYRQRLEALYASDLDDSAKQRARDAAMHDMQADHQRLKEGAWAGFAGYDRWFASANNATLGVLAAYNEWADDFERLFVAQGRDFTRFYAEVARLAALPKAERHAALQALQ
jgi:predicted aminopeptidase